MKNKAPCIRNTLACLLLLALVSVQAHTAHAGAYRQIIEEEKSYQAVKGDYLGKIAGNLGVELGYLVRHNPQKRKYVYVGDTFHVTRRIIVPASTGADIIINIPDRTLYLFRDGELVRHYPVGLGKRTWQTPTGVFTVESKIMDPSWYVPPSIQREMAQNGDEVKTVVPPGEDNPLGRHAVRLSIPGVLIHATIWPESVFTFSSHGCIRMKAEDAREFFESVRRGDTGRVLYEPVKLAETDGGRVYLEVYRDFYRLSGDPMAEAASLIYRSGLGDRVDWEKVVQAVNAEEGVATDVTATRTWSGNGQKDVFEGGAGGGAYAGTDERAGRGAYPFGKDAQPVQYTHGRVPEGDIQRRDGLHPGVHGEDRPDPQVPPR